MYEDLVRNPKPSARPPDHLWGLFLIAAFAGGVFVVGLLLRGVL